MAGCCNPRGCDQFFNPRFARRVAKRYRKRGLDKPTRQIVEFLERRDLDGATVLEVGGGVGEIGLELLKRGAQRAINLELSPAYEEEAARLTRPRPGDVTDLRETTLWLRHSGEGSGARLERSAFKPSDLPGEAAGAEGAAQTASLGHGQHGRRRVGEGAELAAEQTEAEILRGDDRARDEVAWRVAEDQRAGGVVRRGAEQPLVVRVAADDAVEHHDVDRLHAARIDSDVVAAPLDAPFQARLRRRATVVFQWLQAGWTALSDAEREEVRRLVTKAHGRPRNLTRDEARRLGRLAAKAANAAAARRRGGK